MAEPLDHLLNAVEWQKNDAPADLTNDTLWATHSGVLSFAGISLKVHQLSNGQRVIDAEDFEKFLAP